MPAHLASASAPHYSRRRRPLRLIFRDKATTQWHRGRPTIGASDGRADDAASSSFCRSQIRPRETEGNESRRRRRRRRRRRMAPTRPPRLRLRCAAAAIGVRFSEQLMCRKENLSDVFPSISLPRISSMALPFYRRISRPTT